MRILLTNDDGIDSPGLLALWRELRDRGDVVIVAPTREQSGVGHAISIQEELHVFPWDVDGRRCYAVHGTPSDCVKVALYDLLDRPPDLVLSGINHGLNIGINAFYSGTVAAALEAAMNGVPSVALSADGQDFRTATRVAARIVEHVEASGMPSHTILNVNVPAGSNGELRVTRHSDWGLREVYDRVEDDLGRATLSARGVAQPVNNGVEYDDAAVEAGYVSVTPMHIDLTHHGSLARLRETLEDR